MSHRLRQGVLISSTLLAASMICAATPTASSVLAEAIHTPAMVQDSSTLSPNTTNQAQAIVDAAASQEGLTYCWDGGTTSGPSHGGGDYDGEAPDCVNPDTVGFDCSGLALYAVFQATGIVLPHNAAEQGADYASYGGTLISSQSNLEPGDLVYFGGGSMVKATHVGIYAGDGEMRDANTAWGSYPDGVLERSMSRTEEGSAGLPFDGGVRYWSGKGSPPRRPTSPVTQPYVTWSTEPSLPAGFVEGVFACAGSLCLTLSTSGNRTLELVRARWEPVASSPPGVGRVASLSCPTASFCMAVADASSPAGRDKLGYGLSRISAYAVSWRSGTWQKPFHAYSYTATDTTYLRLDRVACPSATFCMVAATPSGSMSWNGSHWSAYRGETTGTDGNGTLACASPSFCFAGFDMLANPWRKGTWALSPTSDNFAPFTIPSFNGLSSGLACPTTNFCIAADARSSFATWNGRTWTASTITAVPGSVWAVGQVELDQIACASSSFCLGTDGYGGPGFWDGISWQELAYEPGENFADVQVACATGASICYVVSGRSVEQYQFLTHGAHAAGFYTARQVWLDSVCVDMAQKGEYWKQAAADLRPAAQSQPAYAAVVRALTNLASFPETDQTPAQQHEMDTDWDAISRFFDTPDIE
jgi:cell wall-associated NlpC family hydrolase